MSGVYVLLCIIFLVAGPILVFAQDYMDIAQMASLLQSLQQTIDTLAKKVQDGIPIVFAAPQSTDLTRDGIVGESDWLFMRDRWFSNDKTADINGDGIVNAIDFGLLNRNWNKSVE